MILTELPVPLDVSIPNDCQFAWTELPGESERALARFLGHATFRLS